MFNYIVIITFRQIEKECKVKKKKQGNIHNAFLPSLV